LLKLEREREEGRRGEEGRQGEERRERLNTKKSVGVGGRGRNP